MTAARQPVEWRRFGRDIVVIILGVLIALAFDNWAAGRSDRRSERLYLQRLGRDLRADSVMLADYHRTAVVGESAARTLLSNLSDAARMPDSAVARNFSDATRGAYLSPHSPTIEELKSTGNLRVIRSDTLRDAILTYYADIAWYQRSLQTVMQRGKDPLGEVGWDIQAFDPALSYAVNLGGISRRGPERTALETNVSLGERLRQHPGALTATQRAVTYNGMLQPILEEWQLALATLRQQLPPE